MLKRAESHRCEVNTLWILACNFSTFLRFLKGIMLENRLQNLIGVTDFSQKNSKIIENVSYFIRYCKISLLVYSGSSSLSNNGRS